MFVFISIIDPQLNRFEKYERLNNWDLGNHAVGDFDGDGKKDLVDSRGCAFFSSLDTDKINQKQQCVASMMTKMYLNNKGIIGQKYIPMEASNLEARDFQGGNNSISHTYLFKKPNENWKIFVNSGELSIFEIRKDGLLKKLDNVPFVFRLDELLYSMSFLTILLALHFAFVFSWTRFPLIILPIITVILYFLWKRINPFSMIDSM